MIKIYALILTYFGFYTRFLDNSEEYCIDHKLEVDAFLDISPNLNIGSGYVSSHIARGDFSTNLTQSVEPDRWINSQTHGKLLYGRPDSLTLLDLLMQVLASVLR